MTVFRVLLLLWVLILGAWAWLWFYCGLLPLIDIGQPCRP